MWLKQDGKELDDEIILPGCTFEEHVFLAGSNTPVGQRCMASVRLVWHVTYSADQVRAGRGLEPSGSPTQLGRREEHGSQVTFPAGHRFWK